ncbi:MAG: hypothetical protein KAV41_02835 [Candidatus Pacebacteria bacterium]|nr:hypothetical protein [Candidatus Paceibacterota bacterium]
MKSIKHHISQTLKIISLALILTTGFSIALAWTGPTAAPPGNNTDEPLNTSNNWQTKYGYLSLPKLIDSNDGQTGYYLDPGANSWLYRLYSYDIRSSIFYDQDNTDYYVDPASTSKLNRVDASIVYDRDNTAYYSNPASTSYYNDMRANIYYDKGNTGYYVDPASTSKFNTINLGGVSKSSWPSEGTWPAGSYCILANGSCPSGFSQSSLGLYVGSHAHDMCAVGNRNAGSSSCSGGSPMARLTIVACCK